MDMEKIKRLDSSIYRLAKSFQVLKHLSWPTGADEKFLRNWRKGTPRLPHISLEIPNQQFLISQLERLRDECSADEPIEKFLFDTADSYVLAGKMLQSVGTKKFSKYSKQIYGAPDDPYKNQYVTGLDAARYLLEVTKHLLHDVLVPETSFDIPPEKFAKWIRQEVNNFFGEDKVEVVVDETISARALASSKKVKISSEAIFSELDKKQLLNHEAFIHTASMINGKLQPLQCLSLGAPRTTRTQEGLAVISEILTMSIDIIRLRRIALRVIAVHMALNGADFIEVFKYFLAEGQTEEDAVRSTQRIFRGGDVKGGVVFTKDSVYLKGVYELHTFMRHAISENKISYIQNLFAARLTIGDVIRLGPCFDNQFLKAPIFVPDWAKDFRLLSAAMAFSAFVNHIDMDSLSFDDFMSYEDRLKLMHAHNLSDWTSRRMAAGL